MPFRNASRFLQAQHLSAYLLDVNCMRPKVFTTRRFACRGVSCRVGTTATKGLRKASSEGLVHLCICCFENADPRISNANRQGECSSAELQGDYATTVESPAMLRLRKSSQTGALRRTSAEAGRGPVSPRTPTKSAGDRRRPAFCGFEVPYSGLQEALVLHRTLNYRPGSLRHNAMAPLCCPERRTPVPHQPWRALAAVPILETDEKKAAPQQAAAGASDPAPRNERW